MLHIKVKVRSVQQHASKNYALTDTIDPWDEVKRSKEFFSEGGHIAYQIKEDHFFLFGLRFYIPVNSYSHV